MHDVALPAAATDVPRNQVTGIDTDAHRDAFPCELARTNARQDATGRSKSILRMPVIRDRHVEYR